jgi:hypothetical protein
MIIATYDFGHTTLYAAGENERQALDSLRQAAVLLASETPGVDEQQMVADAVTDCWLITLHPGDCWQPDGDRYLVRGGVPRSPADPYRGLE